MGRYDIHRRHSSIAVSILTSSSGNGIVSYYLAPILKSVGITSSVTQAVINLALQIWNAFFAFGGALSAERFGRRPLWLISACGMLASFIVVTALSATFAEHAIKAAGSATVAFLFIFFAFYDIAFTPLSIAYPVEILPFSLRAKGLAVNLTTVFSAGCEFEPIAFEFIVQSLKLIYCFSFQPILQPDRTRSHRLEVLLRLHRHSRGNDSHHLLPLPRNQGSYP
jgi:hypothetical protein